VSASAVTGRILTAPAINSHNTFDTPNAVKPEAFSGATVQGGNLVVTLPAKSVVVLELQ
jgi:alpha-N-arabinofuranosidase